MIENRTQQIIIHRYAGWAGMSKQEYRELLLRHTGKTSITDQSFTQADFERAMAAIETILWQRLDEGLVQDPRDHGLSIERYHWRERLPKVGCINSRLRRKIEQLWGLLCDYLPEENRTDRYLAGIISRGFGSFQPNTFFDGRDINWQTVPSEAARLAVDALKDRLKYAVKVTSDVPF